MKNIEIVLDKNIPHAHKSLSFKFTNEHIIISADDKLICSLTPTELVDICLTSRFEKASKELEKIIKY